MDRVIAPDPLEEVLRRIAPIDPTWRRRAAERQTELTKPAGSLGRLEWIANRLCAIQETLSPSASPRRIVLFASDHGVAAESVSAYPPEVTAQMIRNFLCGGAAINAMARLADAEVLVVDVGVAGAVEAPEASGGARLVSRRVRAGTRNLAREAAMSEGEMRAALAAGIEQARAAAESGVALLGLGEMGIGNTTAASAITAALTGLPVARVTGRGAGLDDAGLARKVQVIQNALDRHAPRPDAPLEILRRLGGLDIAALCGLCLGAAAYRRAILADGFITTAAVAIALRLHPAVSDYLFAAHRSTEPGHAALLEQAGLRPLLDLEMRLGEGTGAALAMGVVAAAVAAFREMATFGSAGVSERRS